jgi:hypothetical protein
LTAEHDTDAPLHWRFAGLFPPAGTRRTASKAATRRASAFLTKLACPNGNSWGYRADLITNYGRHFLRAICDFSYCISPKHRAMRDGHPVVPPYAAAFAKKWDARFLGRLKALFPKEFQGAIRGSLRRFPGA